MVGAVLVTGVPRSGTTWVARTLAARPGVAMPGREPMNPERDKGQYALAHTLDGWARLTRLTRGQRLALRACYAGLEPRGYSRYGVRRWAAALPWTRVVVKDPYAMLSLPVVVEATGAIPVLVYRHPAAVLASYRRMGWRPDMAEIVQMPDFHRLRGADADPAEDDVAAMAQFWRFLNGLALDDLSSLPRHVVLSHAELAAGGAAALGLLCARLGLTPPAPEAAPPAAVSSPSARTALHNLDRDPSGVADGWRADVTEDELSRMEDLAGDVLEDLTARRLVLSADAEGGR